MTRPILSLKSLWQWCYPGISIKVHGSRSCLVFLHPWFSPICHIKQKLYALPSIKLLFWTNPGKAALEHKLDYSGDSTECYDINYLTRLFLWDYGIRWLKRTNLKKNQIPFSVPCVLRCATETQFVCFLCKNQVSSEQLPNPLEREINYRKCNFKSNCLELCCPIW